MKLNEFIKCPHCQVEREYVFYDNAKTLECLSCKKPFDIKLQTKIEVISSMPKRECRICNHDFIADTNMEDYLVCPKCGTEGGHYKIIV